MTLILSGDGSVGPLSSTEMGYLDGVTSAVQTQINSKVTTPGAWTLYTPVLSSSGTAVNVGSGATRVGYYTQVGKTITYKFLVALGTGVSAGSGYYRVSLPVVGVNPLSSINACGVVMMYDNSAAIRRTLFVMLEDGNNMLFRQADGTLTDAATPWTWADGDQISGQITYEAA